MGTHGNVYGVGAGMWSVRSLAKTLLATVSASALAVGLAGPASASNNLQIKIDPLGSWNWSGSINIYDNENCETYATKGIPNKEELFGCFDKANGTEDHTTDTAFNLGPGGGPQGVYGEEVTLFQEFYVVVTGELTGGGVTVPSQGFAVEVSNVAMGKMSKWDYDDPRSPDNAVNVGFSFSKQEDPATGEDYYELKFFPKEEAPALVPALANLAQVQSAGVKPDDCTHSVALSPGDTLTGTDGDDTVCVTLDDNGDSGKPVTVDTGDGSDTVLINGDTDAPVKVDTGDGDDVVVSDTDADVEVTTGDGNDAVVDGGNTTHADASDKDGTVTAPADDVNTDSGSTSSDVSATDGSDD